MTTRNDGPRFEADAGRITVNGRVLPLLNGVIPADFPQRLVRLKEATGLTWTAFSYAVGADPKQMRRWRRGVEPCGGAMLSLVLFAMLIPGGLEILSGETFRLTFWHVEG